MDPLAGELKARYPNSLYVTLLNKDVTQTPLDQPITVNYWLELVDPSLKVEEYSTGLIPPSWVLKQSTVISTKKGRFENDRFIEETEDEEEDGVLRILIMVFFIIAFIVVCGLFITYYVMMQRKKTMQLQKAIASGKVTLRDSEDDDLTDGLGISPDKQVEMQDRRSQRNNESHRQMIEGSSEFSERFGNVHMNETALEYFQGASMAGKTSEQMIKEFQAIQRYKEEELIQQQLN